MKVQYDKITIVSLMIASYAIIMQIVAGHDKIQLPWGIIILLSMACLVGLRVYRWLLLIPIALSAFVLIGSLAIPGSIEHRFIHPSAPMVAVGAAIETIGLLGATIGGVMTIRQRNT